MYTYKIVRVAKVVDGDTFDFDLDLGFYAIMRVRVRLLGIDTWEMWGRNAHELGVPARDAAAEWMRVRIESGTLRVRTSKLRPGTPVGDGSFGRWAGAVYDEQTDELLADHLRENGFEKQSNE